MGGFEQATHLELTERLDGATAVYAGSIKERWDIVGNANGGYLMAMLARAALLDAERKDVISISANFLSPGKPGPVTITAQEVKTGKRFATRRCDLRSGDRLLVAATVITGNLDDGEGPRLVDAPMPEMPAADELPRVEATDLFPPPFMDQIDLRLHPDHLIGSGNGPKIRAWFRLPDDEPMDTSAIVMAADGLPPTVFNADLPVGWSPTIQMTTHLRARPTTEWVLVDTYSRVIKDGMFEADAVVYDEHGEVICQARQLQLLAQP